MSTLLDQISKAKARNGETDLQGLADYARDKTPQQLDTIDHLAQRRQFLRDSLGSVRRSEDSFERIIAGNEIQDINYLVRGARASKAVARIAIRNQSGQRIGWGTGFLIAPNVLLTNNHVLPTSASAARSEAHFDYELDIDGTPLDFLVFGLEPSRLFHTSAKLDFTVVAVRSTAENGATPLNAYGWLPLVGTLGKITEGEWLTIIQHPRGERKQICIRENQLIKRDPDVLWYSTDTLGGSSGSPVFNNDWYVIALHHAGVPHEKDGQIQTLAGRDFNSGRDAEEDIHWVANEGIRVSRIVETLRRSEANHPLLAAVFSATAENSRLELPPDSVMQAVVRTPRTLPIPLSSPLSQEDPRMNTATGMTLPRDVLVRLRISESGGVSVVDATPGAIEAFSALEAAKPKAKKKPAFDVPFNANYDDRKGYAPGFLGTDKSLHVQLPRLSPDLQSKAVKLLVKDPTDAKNTVVLKYHNYSAVMHSKRRFAIYTAANIDFGGRYDLDRPADVWRTDPRIPLESQVSNFYYASNQFDRGHLTRREDLEFGSTRKDALLSAADTCHWVNCVPQHAKFNQNKDLWQGIERYLLEDSIKTDQFRAQVFTGPVLSEDDPVWDRFELIQYPVLFWKVVAAVTESGNLFATAYLLDQTEVIDQYGIEAAPEVPFGAYKTFQVSIAEVERLTGLSFFSGAGAESESLSRVDPMAAPRARRAAVSRRESTTVTAPEGYVALESLRAIVRD